MFEFEQYELHHKKVPLPLQNKLASKDKAGGIPNKIRQDSRDKPT